MDDWGSRERQDDAADEQIVSMVDVLNDEQQLHEDAAAVLGACDDTVCTYSQVHFFSLCQLTTLTTHNSFSLSLPAQDLPLPQIFPTIDSLPASGLTPRTSRLDRFF